MLQIRFITENRGVPKSAGPVAFATFASQGRRQRGGQWRPVPLFEIGTPHFTFGPPVAAYIQYCI